MLISKFSASASEILAGAIQDYGRGLIVGDHSTHGKGTVQSLLDLGQQLFRIPNAPQMGALKITMQQFYRPDGDSTQKRGVLADIELPSLTTHLDVGEADLDYPVTFDQVEPLNFKRFGYVNPAICDQLRQLSEQRVQVRRSSRRSCTTSPATRSRRTKKYVTLNEAKFLKERAELNADKEEEKAIEKLNDPNGNRSSATYYLDEVLAITADYPKLQSAVKPPGMATGARIRKVPARTGRSKEQVNEDQALVALIPSTFRRSLVRPTHEPLSALVAGQTQQHAAVCSVSAASFKSSRTP